MTPNELYKRTPERIDQNLYVLYGCYYNHIPEIEEFDNSFGFDFETNDRVEIHFYKDFDFDGRRFWRLASVKMDGEFVMIIQNAGREGDDYVDRFITNPTKYKEMVEYIKSLIVTEYEDLSEEHVVDGDVDCRTLTKFYGNELDGYFTRY